MDRQTLAQEITQYLTEQGAVRVGFADLHGVTGASLPYGITALVALPREIVGPLVDQPHRAYYDAYQAINVRLDAMAEGCAALLRTHGYQATANTEEHLPTGAEDRSPLPHKAVACRAGLGWIGKNNLLTAPDFGGAVRLCTVVTDAPLPTAEPILSSRCGSCRVCVDACPSSALYGTLWHTGLDRDDLFDHLLCERTAKERTGRSFGIPIAICGKCFAVCPYTQRYLKSE